MSFWKTVISEGVIKIGLIVFLVPTTMIFSIDLYHYLTPSKIGQIRSFNGVRVVLENLPLYLGISLLGGLIGGFVLGKHKNS